MVQLTAQRPDAAPRRGGRVPRRRTPVRDPPPDAMHRSLGKRKSVRPLSASPEEPGADAKACSGVVDTPDMCAI